MKMDTIASPWRYDAATRYALKFAKLRRPAIQHCASWTPHIAAGPVDPS
jgi:hypothetical protein